MINSVMNRLQDFTFFSQLMANANMGWWKANLSTEVMNVLNLYWSC